MNDHNKLEELSFILPVVGVFLFSPVLLSIFTDERTLFGAPLLHIYLFFCWLALIAGSYFLTRHLSESAPSQFQDKGDRQEINDIDDVEKL